MCEKFLLANEIRVKALLLGTETRCMCLIKNFNYVKHLSSVHLQI